MREPKQKSIGELLEEVLGIQPTAVAGGLIRVNYPKSGPELDRRTGRPHLTVYFNGPTRCYAEVVKLAAWLKLPEGTPYSSRDAWPQREAFLAENRDTIVEPAVRAGLELIRKAFPK